MRTKRDRKCNSIRFDCYLCTVYIMIRNRYAKIIHKVWHDSIDFIRPHYASLRVDFASKSYKTKPCIGESMLRDNATCWHIHKRVNHIREIRSISRLIRVLIKFEIKVGGEDDAPTPVLRVTLCRN